MEGSCIKPPCWGWLLSSPLYEMLIYIKYSLILHKKNVLASGGIDIGLNW